MSGFFCLVGSNIQSFRVNDIVGALDPMRNCEKKTIEWEGIVFASTYLKEKPLKGAFSFEDDKWIILFDGDLVDSPIPLEDEGIPWRRISEIFERRRYQDFQNLRGVFSIGAFNKKDRTLFLVTDRIGMFPLYYLKLSDGFSFSTSLPAFLCLQENLEVDFRFIYDWLFFNFPIGKETPLQDVCRLERASVMEISEGGKAFSIRKYAPDFKASDKLTDGKEAFDLALNVFEERIPKYFTDRVPMAVSVTGGWDGVTNLAFRPQNISVQTYTYGIEGTDDIIGGARASKALGLPHIPLHFDENVLRLLPNHCIKTVALSGGTQGILRSTLLPVYESLPNRYNLHVVLSGIAASNVLRGRSNTPSLISPGVKALFGQERKMEDLLEQWEGFFSKEHEVDFFGHIESRIKDLESQFGPLAEIESQLLYHTYIVFPRYFGGEYNLARNWLTLRMPFIDSDILDFIFGTKIAGLGFSEYAKTKSPPHDERRLQAFLIARKSPVLTNITIGNVSPEDIIRPGISSIPARLFRKSLDRLRGYFHQRPPLENWDGWVDGPLSEFMKRFVLSPKSRISKIVARKAIEDLFREHKNPIRTNMIGKLCTVEIACRLIENKWKEDFQI